MKYLRETTRWEFPNHTYIVSPQNWLAGYIKEGTDAIVWFSKPFKGWSQSRRTFVDVTKEYATCS